MHNLPLIASPVILALALSLGCGSDSEDPSDTQADGPTYFRDAKAIVDARCATCHRSGDIGPFPLTTHEEVMAFEGPVRASIENGTMPPWMPAEGCGDYVGSIDLTAEEKSTLLAWLDAGAPQGEETDAPQDPTESDTPLFEADLSLRLPEPYTPTLEPDDYRCQLIPWPAEETRYVTGLRVTPDQRAIVHHTIAFVVGPDQVERFRAYDDAEEGPGYTCYGGPTASTEEGGGLLSGIDLSEVLAALERLGLTLEDLRSGNLTTEQIAALFGELDVDSAGGFSTLGSWVPGTPAGPFPVGTGIKVEPGSMIVAQMHYNTSSANPVADQSVIEISTAATVEREATNLLMVDLGWVSDGLFGDPMTIPAGEPNVAHETTAGFNSVFMTLARRNLGLADDAPLLLHTGNHHMHELGTSQRSEVRHADGGTSCILDIPDWDFAWQGAYGLKNPISLGPGDELWMGCTWDNSAANQPIIDGQAKQPTDVSWGEGTSDEMCLGGFYVTAG